jgi:hypothetical protein
MGTIERRTHATLVQLAAMLLIGAIASAQPSPSGAEPADYYPRIEQAVHAYELGHWPEAYASFQQAHDLLPNARTLRGLALTAYKLRRYAETERHIEAALASSIKPLTEPQRAELLQLLEWARRYIARVELKVQPQQARALVDGVAATGTSLALDMGEHELTVRAPGHVTHQQRFVAEGARQLQLKVSLVPVAVSPKRATSSDAAARPARSLFASPWLWTAVGVVAAGTVVFAVTREGDVEQRPPFRGGAALLMGPTQ